MRKVNSTLIEAYYFLYDNKDVWTPIGKEYKFHLPPYPKSGRKGYRLGDSMNNKRLSEAESILASGTGLRHYGKSFLDPGNPSFSS